MLTQELSTSQNIKSKQVRKLVKTALKQGLQQLKQVKSVPENGLILCSGEISSYA